MKLLTANRLTDGSVLWLAADGAWSASFAEAVTLDDEAADAALAAAVAQPRLLVGPYLIATDERGVDPRERVRETIRANGPSVGHSLEAL